MELETSNVTLTINNTPILDNISCRITNGQMVGLIGPNGSGKSSLMRCMANIEKNYQGNITYDCKAIKEYKQSEYVHFVSYLPPELSSPFDFTAYEIVLMGKQHIYQWRQFPEELKEKAHAVMKALSCFKYKDRNIFQLSSGERQRVFLARTIFQAGDLLLLDEPTNYLDPKHQHALMEYLRNNHKEQDTASLVILHNLPLAFAYCDYLFVLDKGKLVLQGECEFVRQNPMLHQIYDIPLDKLL